MVQDEVAGCGVAEQTVVGVGGDYRELLDDVQVEGLALKFLSGGEIEGYAVQVSRQ